MLYSDSAYFNISAGKRYVLFVLSVVMCFIVGSVATAFFMGSTFSIAKLRIAMVVQDIFLFIAPALIFAAIASRRPGWLLQIERGPGRILPLLTLCALVVSVPAMNVVIEWNQNLTLPDALAPIEQWMRGAEERAGGTIKSMMGQTSVGSLVMSMLIVGVMAGFSEELFFRGAMQRLIQTTPCNGHVAVWVTAVIFSAIHLQFFGFFPRLLLGAFFGYILWWSGSLWLAMLGHVFNNCMAVFFMWMAGRAGISYSSDSVVTGNPTTDCVIAVCSAILTAIILVQIYRVSKRRKKSLPEL